MFVKSVLVASAMEWDRRLMEQVRFIVMILLWMAAWFARTILVFLPHQQQLQSSSDDCFTLGPGDSTCASGGGFLGMVESMVSKSLLPLTDAGSNNLGSNRIGGRLAKSAIGRALSQALELVNDIPASSRKYEFARSLADKIICDNIQHGGQALKDVNTLALETSFLRTASLLETSLDGLQRQQQVEGWGWPWKILKGVPGGAASLGCHLFPVLGTVRKKMQLMFPAPAAPTTSEDDDFEMAEKLSQELLWIARRFQENRALETAILHWSSSASLAAQSVYASTRVQKLLVKLSAFLYTGLVSSEVEPPTEVTLRMLLLWLPLLCRSTHGIDGHVLSSSEKLETERVLERTIGLLPEFEQELVLGLWLREYALSNSDWPNLQACFNTWCYSTRKLNFAAPDTCCTSSKTC